MSATTELKAAAKIAGYAAAKEGKMRVPALCAAYIQMTQGFAVGTGAADLAKCWLQGYFDRCEEEAVAI